MLFFSFHFSVLACRFSCDFICLRSSAYIVVVAQFFLVFLSTVDVFFFVSFFFFTFSWPQILCKCCYYFIFTVFVLSRSALTPKSDEIPTLCFLFTCGPPRLYPSKSLNDNRSVQSQSHSRRFSLIVIFFFARILYPLLLLFFSSLHIFGCLCSFSVTTKTTNEYHTNQAYSTLYIFLATWRL